MLIYSPLCRTHSEVADDIAIVVPLQGINLVRLNDISQNSFFLYQSEPQKTFLVGVLETGSKARAVLNFTHSVNGLRAHSTDVS